MTCFLPNGIGLSIGRPSRAGSLVRPCDRAAESRTASRHMHAKAGAFLRGGSTTFAEKLIQNARETSGNRLATTEGASAQRAGSPGSGNRPDRAAVGARRQDDRIRLETVRRELLVGIAGEPEDPGPGALHRRAARD